MCEARGVEKKCLNWFLEMQIYICKLVHCKLVKN